MTGLALALVLASAVAHATWNLFAKRAATAGAPFLWLSLTLAIPLYAPLAVAVLLITGTRPVLTDVLWMFGSAALNVAYFVFLQRGYRVGDLSVVYPLARGTGPVLSIVAAIAILGERPTPIAIAGAVAIAIGVFMLAGDPRRLQARGMRAVVGWALLTGVTIAAYTLWDKRGVSVLLIPPMLYE
ncbi:MAG TPA: EamA family transporter [Candidatus Limnocylindria bacterium]|nr:EamA family transporter [Candidatus Limnocylindria bacterium]